VIDMPHDLIHIIRLGLIPLLYVVYFRSLEIDLRQVLPWRKIYGMIFQGVYLCIFLVWFGILVTLAMLNILYLFGRGTFGELIISFSTFVCSCILFLVSVYKVYETYINRVYIDFVESVHDMFRVQN
jgi:hypothetical protein